MKTKLGLLTGVLVSTFFALPAATAQQIALDVSIRCPNDLQVSCLSEVPPPALTLDEFIAQGGDLTTDCPGRTRFSFAGEETSGSCPLVITRHYQADGPCGASKCAQIITVLDQEPPRLGSTLGGTVDCGVPTKITIAGDDNCAPLQFSAQIVGGTAAAGATLVELEEGTFELTLTTTGYVDIAFSVSDGCNKVTRVLRYATVCEEAAEGCSHGFWKNHTGLWDEAGDAVAIAAGFNSSTSFNTFFGISSAQSVLPDGATMLDALNKGGGTPDGSQLARDGVAGLLNIAAGLNYDFPNGVTDAAGLKAAITAAYVNHVFSPLSGELGHANEQEGEFCD